MRFPYSTVILKGSGPDDLFLMNRPEIQVTLAGENSMATLIGLVDTGSDYCIFPRSIADDLGISLRQSMFPPASVFGGRQVELLVGEAELQLVAESETISWTTTLCFFNFGDPEDETVILGHAGFLDYFTATFDGQDAG